MFLIKNSVVTNHKVTFFTKKFT